MIGRVCPPASTVLFSKLFTNPVSDHRFMGAVNVR